MRGHLRERSPGHWAIVIDTRDPATGKRKRRWHSFAGTKRQAQVECARLLTEQKAGTAVDPSRDDGRGLPRTLARAHAGPGLAAFARALCRDRPQEPRAAAGRLDADQTTAGPNLRGLRQGAHQRPPGRAGRAIRRAPSITCTGCCAQALQQAVRWQLLTRNPADLVKPPGSSASRCRPSTPTGPLS